VDPVRSTRRIVRCLLCLACLWPASRGTRAEDASTIADPAPNPAPTRPAIGFNRWQEDWSVLADPALRTQPFDALKYIPLSKTNPKSYLSWGANLRERFERIDAPAFGTGPQHGDSYLIQRAEIHADLRPNEHWQIFAQLQDDRAFEKKVITPVDKDEFDLEQAFVTYTGPFAGGTVKARLGRQEMGFDLQRFVAVRDGPNVRQAFDAAWLDWELPQWRFITFWSKPVQNRSDRAFDDHSNHHLQFGGFRIERANLGPGDLSIYYSRFQQDNAEFLDAAGNERRNIVDMRYAGGISGFDWDIEGMGQFGRVGSSDTQAWAFGARTGYTFADIPWQPRLGLQVDAASGDRHPNDGKLETFNPLFPNGYYFTLAGFTGYSNLIHVKPSVTVKPVDGLTLMGAVGLQWRESTADAVYVQPDIPVAGTAGEGGSWSGYYLQGRADWAVTADVATAVEVVHFDVGNAIRSAGGRNSDYLGVELKLGW
jgi:hypothetical protein